MAFYDKYIPKELKRPVDKLLDFGTDTFKKTGRAVRKLTPRELRPALPFLASAVPFMLPGGGIFASGLNRALASSLANTLSQEALDPEGDINYLSAALAGLTGAGASQGAAGESAGETLRGMRGGPFTTDKTGILQSLKDAPIGTDKLSDLADTRGFFGKARDLGLTGLAEATDFLGGARETMAGFGSDPGSLFTKEGAKALGKAITVPAAQGTGDLAFTEATRALREFNATEAAELAQAGADAAAIADARRNAIRYAMEVSGFEEDEIMETFDELGLKDGGRVGFREGGLLQQLIRPQASQITTLTQRPLLGSFQPLQQAQAVFPRLNELEQGVNRAEQDLGNIRNRLGNEQRQGLLAIQPSYGIQPFANMNSLLRSPLSSLQQGQQGDNLPGMKDGGMLDFGGKEMDLRGGGFVPIGKKERADDVPARLSKNEFVMTADAVRAAGGGSVNKGAQRMYDLMNNLEARA